MSPIRDEFLSEEDLDLATLTSEELEACWMAWLRQAQITNEVDERSYSHGVFERVPDAAWPACGAGDAAHPTPAGTSTSLALAEEPAERSSAPPGGAVAGAARRAVTIPRR